MFRIHLHVLCQNSPNCGAPINIMRSSAVLRAGSHHVTKIEAPSESQSIPPNIHSHGPTTDAPSSDDDFGASRWSPSPNPSIADDADAATPHVLRAGNVPSSMVTTASTTLLSATLLSAPLQPCCYPGWLMIIFGSEVAWGK
jgi:hypothetical protein